MRDYAIKGRLAVATPQANPTVEAEVRRVLPNEVDYCTARLLSESKDPKTRLIEYLTALPETVKCQFSGMTADILLFGCTASSYLTDENTENEIMEKTSEILDGAKIVNAARAIKEYFKQNKIKTIGILTPYPEWLQVQAERYWTEQGFEVAATERVDIGTEDTNKIYDLSSNDAKPGLMSLIERNCEAILISGTGMPSLRLISELDQPNKKIISSNYAMALVGLSYLGLKPRKKTEWFS